MWGHCRELAKALAARYSRRMIEATLALARELMDKQVQADAY